MRKKVINIKVSGFTIIEVLVAIIIIMLSIGIFFSIFINVRKTDFNHTKTKAYIEANSIIEKSIKEKLFEDEEYVYEGFKIVKKISQYQDYSDIILLNIEVLNKENNNLILSIKKTAIKEEEDVY